MGVEHYYSTAYEPWQDGLAEAAVKSVTLANRRGCNRCIGMYWDVFWMYQIFFGCINIPIHHRCIEMYFRGIMMYSTMYCDVLPDVLRCIPLLLMNPNTSPNTSQYISEYITIHLVIHPSTFMMYWDVLHCQYMTNTLK